MPDSRGRPLWERWDRWVTAHPNQAAVAIFVALYVPAALLVWRFG